ncbi:hypothetical protein HCJ39_10015, partial [Listeria rocourtiae]|uniref:toxin Cry1Ac domain D-VI-related protein n=1 Tax=Listeria rocourtiae TaxID=647910 RepID=UPI0017FE0E61
MRKKVLATITAASIATSSIMSPVSVFAQSVTQGEGTVDNVTNTVAYNYSNLLKNTEFKINPDMTLDHWDINWDKFEDKFILFQKYLANENEMALVHLPNNSYPNNLNYYIITMLRTLNSTSGERGFVFHTNTNKTLAPSLPTDIQFKQRVDNIDPLHQYQLRFNARAYSYSGEKLKSSDAARIAYNSNTMSYVIIDDTKFKEYSIPMSPEALANGLNLTPIASSSEDLDTKIVVTDLRLVDITEEALVVDAEKTVKELFVSNNPANVIKTTVTQATIDAAQAKVNAVKDTAKKAELQAHINKAQAELSAKTEAEKAVKELFVSNNPANVIKTTVTQATIDAAQAKVNAVKDTAKKAELQAHINKAQAELNAKVAAEKAVKELFVSNNPANTIKETVTQATIDAAQAKVNAV